MYENGSNFYLLFTRVSILLEDDNIIMICCVGGGNGELSQSRSIDEQGRSFSDGDNPLLPSQR